MSWAFDGLTLSAAQQQSAVVIAPSPARILSGARVRATSISLVYEMRGTIRASARLRGAVPALGGETAPVTGTASATVEVSAALSGTVRVEGVSTAAVEVLTSASGTVRISGASTAALEVSVVAGGAFSVSGTGSAAVETVTAQQGAVRISGTGSVGLEAHAAVVASVRLAGAASSQLELALASAGTQRIYGTGATSIELPVLALTAAPPVLRGMSLGRGGLLLALGHIVLAPAPTGTPLLVVDGNSHSAEFGGGLDAVDQWPEKLIVAQGMGGWDYENFAVSGQQTYAMAADAATQIDPLYDPERSRNLLLVWEITNHISHTTETATEIYEELRDYCLARQAVGWEVVVFTCMARSSSRGDYESVRQAVNTLVRDNWATFADALVDIGADATLGTPTAYLNTTYFQGDEIHLTPAGQTLVATLVAEQVP